MTEVYILTDAEGFTSCCAARQDALHKEVGRRPMLAPIEVFHWQRVGGSSSYGGWKLVQTFTWEAP